MTVWQERALLHSEHINVSPHAHHALQITVALSGKLAPSDAEGVIVAPDFRHHLNSSGETLTLYLEPTGRHQNFKGMSPLPGALCQHVRKVATHTRWWDPITTARAFEPILEHFALTQTHPTLADPRILRVQDKLRSTANNESLATLAALVHLSPSRLRHLFKDQVGLPIRQYRLWVRVFKALELMAKGRSVTQAAHAAGFSDAAHLSRTVRRTFGRSAVELRKLSRFVQAFHRPACDPV